MHVAHVRVRKANRSADYSSTLANTRFAAVRFSILAMLIVFTIVMIPTAHAQTETILHSFTGGIDGTLPTAGVVLDSKGNLYGTTDGNQTSNIVPSTVFQIDSANNFTVLHTFPLFSGELFSAASGLTVDAQDNLFGIASNVPPTGAVTYEITSAGIYSNLAGTGEITDEPGQYVPAPILDRQHNLCGTNGADIFKITPSGQLSVFFSFLGGGPVSPFVLDPTGNLYGVALIFGQDSKTFSVFKVTPAGKMTTLHKFPAATFYSPGYLSMDSKGNLYGTTSGDGKFGDGTVYKLTPKGVFTVLHNFNGTDGNVLGIPAGPLVMDSAGNIYGATPFGGAHAIGTVFKLTPQGAETVLHNFGDNAEDGASPNGVVMDSSGNLYGTTVRGGANGMGTVFKILP
jgi:uncharacterized repeat protein (TIGR03803 family)